MTDRRKRWMLALTLEAAGCNWHICANDDLDFELAAPDDEITVIVRACAEHGKGDLEVALELDLADEADAPIVVEVEGLLLHPTDRMSWSGGSGFSDSITEHVCGPGDRITVRRFDDQASTTLTGTFSVSASVPHGRSCSASLELEQ